MEEQTTVKAIGTTDKPRVFMKSNIKLVEWTNHNEDKTKSFLNVHVKKVYKDASDEWKETDGFNQRDLALLRDLIDEYLRGQKPMKML